MWYGLNKISCLGRGSKNFHPLTSYRTFNPADYAEPAGTDESYSNSNTWNNTGSFEPDDGTSKCSSYAGLWLGGKWTLCPSSCAEEVLSRSLAQR